MMGKRLWKMDSLYGYRLFLQLRTLYTGAVGLGIEVTKQHIKTQNFYRERFAIAPVRSPCSLTLSYPPCQCHSSDYVSRVLSCHCQHVTSKCYLVRFLAIVLQDTMKGSYYTVVLYIICLKNVLKNTGADTDCLFFEQVSNKHHAQL